MRQADYERAVDLIQQMSELDTSSSSYGDLSDELGSLPKAARDEAREYWFCYHHDC